MPSCDVIKVGNSAWRQATASEKAACLIGPANANAATAADAKAQSEAIARAEAAAKARATDNLAFSEAAKSARSLWSYDTPIRTVPPAFVKVERELRLVNPPANFNEPIREWQNQRERAGLPFDTISYEESQALKAKPTRDQQASSRVAAQSELEGKALARLSPNEKARFEKLAAGLEADPMARYALSTLLLAGTLGEAKAAHGGNSLLAVLAAGLDGAAMAGVDRKVLVADLVQELAEPAAIMQHQFGTCTATTVGIMMARTWPAEYARVALGLASPGGEVRLAGGQVAKRVEARPEGDRRSISAALWSDAMMDLGNGAEVYDGATGRSIRAQGEPYEGLGPEQIQGVMEAVTGKPWAFKLRGGVYDAAKLEQALAQALNKRAVAPVDLDWSSAGVLGSGAAGDPISREGHEVLVVEMGANHVRVLNPHGREETIDRATFRQRLIGVHAAPEVFGCKPSGC